MTRAAGVICLCVVSAFPIFAQSPATPAFEVASVKSNSARTGIRGHSFPGNRFEAKNVPLLELILVAYGRPGQQLPFAQISGGPDWIDIDRFDVSATVADGGQKSVAQKQWMLRALLVERFKLAVHTRTMDLPIYALVLSRKDRTLGPQLHRADIDCEPMLASEPGRRDRCILYALPSGELIVRGQTMSAFANVLTRLLNRFVEDRTGLAGGFDADARFNPDGLPGMSRPPNGQPASDEPSLDVALRDQLGLKLESTHGPVEILVIDHAERPIEN
jgi:uncharacterized protein (TIGR03435 family)